MSDYEKKLASALKALLKERLSPAEEQSLKDEGFVLKNPTRRAAVAIAIYKKAVAGDLSAIKELRSILGGTAQETVKEAAVTIVDDIRD